MLPSYPFLPKNLADFLPLTRFPTSADRLAAWGLKNSNMTFIHRELRTLLYKYVCQGEVVLEFNWYDHYNISSYIILLLPVFKFPSWYKWKEGLNEVESSKLAKSTFQFQFWKGFFFPYGDWSIPWFPGAVKLFLLPKCHSLPNRKKWFQKAPCTN